MSGAIGDRWKVLIAALGWLWCGRWGGFQELWVAPFGLLGLVPSSVLMVSPRRPKVGRGVRHLHHDRGEEGEAAPPDDEQEGEPDQRQGRKLSTMPKCFLGK